MKISYWKHSGYESSGEAVAPVAYLVHAVDGTSTVVVWDNLLHRWQEIDPEMVKVVPDPLGDTRECGWMGCGDPRCNEVCTGVARHPEPKEKHG